MCVRGQLRSPQSLNLEQETSRGKARNELMEGKTHCLGYENVFLEEREPRRKLFDDRRAVARRHEVDGGLHRRARGGGVQERGDVD